MRIGVHQLVFTGIFASFVWFTASTKDYIPNPRDLDERAKALWAEVKLPDTLRSGDLVVRHGRGFISEALLSFSQGEAEYSHSGILKVENGKRYVYHSLGGEGDPEQNKMKKDPLEIFCHPATVTKFAVYRFAISHEEISRLDSVLNSWYSKGLEFDLDFDMETDEKMYCSEMIYKAMGIACKGNNFIPLSRTLEKSYVAVDNLYLNNHCTKIFHHDYD